MLDRKLLVILASMLAASSASIEYEAEESNWANEKPFRILMSWYLRHRFAVTVRIIHSKELEPTYRLQSSRLLALIHEETDALAIVKEHIIESPKSDWTIAESDRDSISNSTLRYSGETTFETRTLDFKTILLVQDELTLNKFFINKIQWRPHAVKFMLIIMIPQSFDFSCKNETDDDKNQPRKKSVKNILESIWSRSKILNVFLSVPTSRCVKNILFKWSPFEIGEKGVFGSMKRLKITENKPNVESSLSAFVNTMKNMNEYPLRVIIFERIPTVIGNFDDEEADASGPVQKNILDIDRATGLDIMVLKTMSSWMNFTIELSTPSDCTEYGYKLDNGTFTGMLGDIVYRRVDFSGNGVFLKDYETGSAAEFTFPIGCENMCVVVPRAGLIPQWLHIFQCFSPLVWSLLLNVVVIYGLLRHILRRVIRSEHPRRSLLDILIETALIFFSSPQRLPELKSERILLGFYLIFSVIILGAFQGTLYEGFTNPEYYKDINTLAELDASGLPIGTSSPNLRNIFGEDEENDSATVVGHLRDKVQVSVSSESSTIARAAWQKNVAAVQRQKDLALTINTEFIDEHGASILHVVEECPMTYPMTYMLPTGTFFLYRMNKLLYRMVESGFTTHWYESTTNYLIMKHHYGLKKKLIAYDKTLPFSLKNLKISFVILACGSTISIIVFIAELLHFRYNNQNNKNNIPLIVIRRNDNLSR